MLPTEVLYVDGCVVVGESVVVSMCIVDISVDGSAMTAVVPSSKPEKHKS